MRIGYDSLRYKKQGYAMRKHRWPFFLISWSLAMLVCGCVSETPEPEPPPPPAPAPPLPVAGWTRAFGDRSIDYNAKYHAQAQYQALRPKPPASFTILPVDPTIVDEMRYTPTSNTNRILPPLMSQRVSANERNGLVLKSADVPIETYDERDTLFIQARQPTAPRRLTPGDTIQLTIANHPEFSGRLTVRRDGSIVFPLTNENVLLFGMTLDEAESVLERTVAPYIKSEPEATLSFLNGSE